MISHELKTPLTSIKMFTELLQAKLALKDDKAKDYLNIIDGESNRLRRLIDNILDAGKIEKGMKSYKLEKIELNEILYGVLEEIRHKDILNTEESNKNTSEPGVNVIKSKKKNVLIEGWKKIDFNNSVTKYYINGDPDAIERAIINLLTNSIKYSDEYATTWVSILIRNGFIGIKVRDSGKGMEKIQLGKIFKPYYRSENESELKARGTGLGLAIVKHIMDAHDGKVEVESEVGKGSTFTLWFPELRNE